MGLIIRFWREYASAHLSSYALGVLFLLLTNGLSVLVPRLIQWAIDALETKQDASQLALALLLAGVGVMVVRTLSRTFIFNPGRTIEYTLKRDLFGHLLTLPKSFYERDMSAGEIINRGTNDSAAVRGLVGYGSLQLFNVAMTLSLTLSQMALIDVSLTLWCGIPLFFAALVLRWAVLQMFTLHRKIMAQTGVLSDRILESYAGVSLVQLFQATQGVNHLFDRENGTLLKLNERVQAIGVWVLPIVSVIGSVCVVLALYLGGGLINQGQLSLGELSAMIVYINLLVSSLTSLGWLTGAIQRGYISLGRIYEVLDTPIDRPLSTTSLPPCPDAGRTLSVKGLTFQHPTSDQNHLNAVSFEVKSGEVVGIFGMTGSGKSTLLDVLSRTYEPPKGSVWMDGVDITTIHLDEYWREIGYVQQTPYLFSQTIRENIALAEPSPQDEAIDLRLLEAVKSAQLAQELESFPDGLETRVGERGVTLSGGQKQRTSLARAFYRDQVRLLMLDDVLSAVDHHTETKLIDAIYSHEPKSTTLIVSHRMSVLQEADRVLVLKDGQLIEQGTPDELLQSEGVYREAWLAQHDYQDDMTQPNPSDHQEHST